MSFAGVAERERDLGTDELQIAHQPVFGVTPDHVEDHVDLALEVLHPDRLVGTDFHFDVVGRRRLTGEPVESIRSGLKR